METKELAIGEIGEIGEIGVKVECVGCKKRTYLTERCPMCCFFHTYGCDSILCACFERSDHTDVYFKKVEE